LAGVNNQCRHGGVKRSCAAGEGVTVIGHGAVTQNSKIKGWFPSSYKN